MGLKISLPQQNVVKREKRSRKKKVKKEVVIYLRYTLC